MCAHFRCERLDHLFSLNYISAESLSNERLPFLAHQFQYTYVVYQMFPHTKCISFQFLILFSSSFVSFFDNTVGHTQYSHPNLTHRSVPNTHTTIPIRTAYSVYAYLNFFITIFGIVGRYRIVDINFKFGSARKAPQIRCHFLCQRWTPFARIPFTLI